jgi:hypothetical protein
MSRQNDRQIAGAAQQCFAVAAGGDRLLKTFKNLSEGWGQWNG